MKVILIDGPQAGRVVETHEGARSFFAPTFHALGGIEHFSAGMLIRDEMFSQVTYNILSVRIGDAEVKFGTVETTERVLGSTQFRALERELTRQFFTPTTMT